MNVEKISFTNIDCKPRKLDFIKYSNKSFTSNSVKKVDECFADSMTRENSIVSLNFLA